MNARLLSLEDPRGVPLLAVVAKRSYRLAGNRLVATNDSVDVLDEAAYAPSSNAGTAGRLVADSDLFAPLKPSTDIVVRARACSTRGPVRMLDTQVQIGTMHKNVRAWGRRTLRLDAMGRPAFSEPEPFMSVPLVWDHAYGGRDAYAEGREARVPLVKQGGDARLADIRGELVYPRNPAGRGFFIDVDRERLVGTEAPCLEDPADPLTASAMLARTALDWFDRPAAACYEPVDWWAFPRLGFWLGAVHEASRRPRYEEWLTGTGQTDLSDRPLGGIDSRAYNCGAQGLSHMRLCGREPVRLWNLHPGREIVEFALPGERPRISICPPGCAAHEMATELASVLIEPETERVTLTWAGTLEVAARYPYELCQTMNPTIRWER